MSRSLFRYACSLTVRSPFLFQGVSAARWGIDSAAIRNAKGNPIIPADQIRGVLKDALLDLPDGMVQKETGLSMDDLFGTVSPGEDQAEAANEPRRSLIHFSDLTALSLTATDEPIAYTRVQIDDQTGAAKDGALQVLELVAGLGAEVTFTGTIDVVTDTGKGKAIAGVLDKALKLIGSIGAMKSSGFGEVRAAQLSLTETHAVPLCQPRPATGQRWRFRVGFDRPILVNSRRLADNATISDHIIPGAAFKGALATMLEQAGDAPSAGPLGDALAALRFSHAFPASGEDAPLGLPLPLSLVSVYADNRVLIADALECPPGHGVLIDGHPARFQSDWKGSMTAEARKHLGLPAADGLRWQQRTHVEIERDSGTASNGKLFTTHLLETDGCHWLLEVDARQITTPQGLEYANALVERLAGGLYGFGSTGAKVTFERLPLADDGPDIQMQGDAVSLVLQTPAMLFHAADAWPEQGKTVDAHTVYAAYFKRELGAELLAFFAEQRLIGGYQSRRRRAYGKDIYFPFVVTQPGAVFRLRIPPERQPDLHRILTAGLPPPPFRETAMSWQNCPFVPENGYGAVALYEPKAPVAGVEVRHV